MKLALINPAWTFDGSVYRGCRHPHLPLEYGYARALLESAGHDVLIVDGQLGSLTHDAVVEMVANYAPDVAVITTAPSYLAWSCAPPELRVPQQLVRDLRAVVRRIVAVGPHGSTSPETTLYKLGADALVIGECEDVLSRLTVPYERWATIPGLCLWDGDTPIVTGGRQGADMRRLPVLRWDDATIAAHRHQHHRFDRVPVGPGAEMEASRRCPSHGTFCAKDLFRNGGRKRPLATVLAELDGLQQQGVEYVYFIDGLFLPRRELLLALADRRMKIGVQTSIDLWNFELIDLLADAGCVSMEAGVQNAGATGRDEPSRPSRLSTAAVIDRLTYARERIPFVQATLIDARIEHGATVERWRERLMACGVWANQPVPQFPYPGSPDYRKRWGAPDSQAWERAIHYYLDQVGELSAIHDVRPLPLETLELPPAGPPARARGARRATGRVTLGDNVAMGAE